METIIVIVSLTIIAVVTLLAVFSQRYEDTITQRIGLSSICIGAIALAKWVYDNGDSPGPITWISIGIAIYVLGTTRKILKECHG